MYVIVPNKSFLKMRVSQGSVPT